MTDTKEGPVDSPGSAEFNRHKIKSANNKFFIDKKSYIPAEEIRDLLSQEHSMQSIEQLQDNWDRIPKAFQVDVVNYLLDAQKEYGKNSLYGKKIENFLASILPSGHEVIKQIEAAIHPKSDAQRLKNAIKTNKDDIEKILRITKGLAAYEEYFSTKATSLTADKLQGMLDFLSKDVPDAKIQRLAL